MPLMSTKVMFEKAMEGHYAIGAFNVNNMEIIQGIVALAYFLAPFETCRISGAFSSIAASTIP